MIVFLALLGIVSSHCVHDEMIGFEVIHQSPIRVTCLLPTVVYMVTNKTRYVFTASSFDAIEVITHKIETFKQHHAIIQVYTFNHRHHDYSLIIPPTNPGKEWVQTYVMPALNVTFVSWTSVSVIIDSFNAKYYLDYHGLKIDLE